MLERRRLLAALGRACSRRRRASNGRGAGKIDHRLRRRLDEERARRCRRRVHQETGVKIVASYAASSALMKQIEQGAPADVFLSADSTGWTTAPSTTSSKPPRALNLLGNRLVLIAPKDSKIGDVKIAPGFDLAALAGNGRIAAGDVRAVPAGLYAKAALEKLGVWAAWNRNWRWPRTCAPRWCWSRAARRRSASSMRPTPGSIRRQDRRGLSGGLASADHLSGGADGDAKPDAARILLSCARRRPKRSSSITASPSW